MTIIEQLARYIAAELGLEFEGTSEGSVFFGYIPQRPVKAICFLANDLKPPKDDEGTRVQIYIRSDKDGAYPLNIGIDIMRLLDDRTDVLFIEGGNYISRIKTERGLRAEVVDDDMQGYSINFCVYYC